MPSTLDPKLDVVFKLLFADPRNQGPLISLLTSVLHPPCPIRSVKVLNPETTKEEIDDKGVTLDVLTELVSGAQMNVEMQAWKRPAQRERALYNWSRQYGGSLRHGDGYEQLKPCVVVFIFAYAELPGSRFHSTFRVLEIHDGTLLSAALEVHAVELPKLRPADETDHEDVTLGQWGRFFAAKTDDERREVAMGNPDIEKANQALERLSMDPSIREVARRREEALLLYRMELGEATRHGLVQGRIEAVDALCDVIGVALDERRRARLTAMSPAELQDLLATLRAQRRWPDD